MQFQIDPELDCGVDAEGHDMESMLFNFLEECLYMFHADKFVACEVKMVDFDTTQWKCYARLRGEKFSLATHVPGTEVKAITYSNMQINQDPETGETQIYVIVDI